ncbi:MAG: YbjQ family protein, partial [Sedimenticolaceae bacterium]
ASRYPPSEPQYHQALVTGSTVISVDYFKRFLAALRSLFGGRIIAYESLLDRARRESLLRMKQQAAALGASMVFNVKYETASISKGRGNSIGSVEVLAYGTALIAPRDR